MTDPTTTPSPDETRREAVYVEIANRAQEITGRSIWPSTVKAVLEVAAALPAAAPDPVVVAAQHIAETTGATFEEAAAGLATITKAFDAAAPDEREATCDAQALDDLDFIAPVGHQVYEATETEPAECTDECTGCMVDRIRDVLLAALAASNLLAVQGRGAQVAAKALREAASAIGHAANCYPDPTEDPYHGCACRLSLLYARADRLEAK